MFRLVKIKQMARYESGVEVKKSYVKFLCVFDVCSAHYDLPCVICVLLLLAC